MGGEGRLRARKGQSRNLSRVEKEGGGGKERGGLKD